MTSLRRIWHALHGQPGPPVPTPRKGPPVRSAAPGRGLLEGRGAVVVGAGPNIGLGIARELAREGARLLLTNSSEADLDEVVDRLRSEGAEPLKLLSDVCDPSAAERLVDRLDRDAFPLDLLVLNAGIHASSVPATHEDGLRVLNTNLVGPLMLARRAVELLRRQSPPGAIVFINSIHARVVRGEVFYSASKAALEMAVKEFALEVAPLGIRINSVAPGWVAAGPDDDPVPHRLTPLYQTSMSAAAIGRAVVFLASPELSPHTTGAFLTVDGGASLIGYATPPLPAISPAP